MTILSKSFFRQGVPVPAFTIRESEAKPEILVQMRRLDALLKAAIARARVLAGNGADDALQGLYISDDEIELLMKRQSGERPVIFSRRHRLNGL
jgi:hypothetical protein